jgi:hypothetical protein
VRGDRFKAARLNVSPGPVAALGEGQEPECSGGEAGDRGGLAALGGKSASIDSSNQSKNGLDGLINRNAEVTNGTKSKDENNNHSGNLLASKSAKLLAATGFDYLVTLSRSLGCREFPVFGHWMHV